MKRCQPETNTSAKSTFVDYLYLLCSRITAKHTLVPSTPLTMKKTHQAETLHENIFEACSTQEVVVFVTFSVSLSFHIWQEKGARGYWRGGRGTSAKNDSLQNVPLNRARTLHYVLYRSSIKCPSTQSHLKLI